MLSQANESTIITGLGFGYITRDSGGVSAFGTLGHSAVLKFRTQSQPLAQPCKACLASQPQGFFLRLCAKWARSGLKLG